MIYDPKSSKAEEFINHEEILESLEYAKANKDNKELIKEILDNLKNLKEKYNELINSEEIINKLKEEQQKIESKMKIIGKKLHDLRVEASEILEIKIKEELSYVGLEKAIIKIDVVLTENMNSRGYDEVQFLVSANPGEPLKPLEKVLSGVELSRIMLALKCVFVDKNKIPTLIFQVQHKIILLLS